MVVKDFPSIRSMFLGSRIWLILFRKTIDFIHSKGFSEEWVLKLPLGGLIRAEQSNDNSKTEVSQIRMCCREGERSLPHLFRSCRSSRCPLHLSPANVSDGSKWISQFDQSRICEMNLALWSITNLRFWTEWANRHRGKWRSVYWTKEIIISISFIGVLTLPQTSNIDLSSHYF